MAKANEWMFKPDCLEDGCKKKRYSRGYCQQHYDKARRRGDFSTTECAAEGCSAPSVTRGHCYKHYMRLFRYGDTEVVHKPKRTMMSNRKYNFFRSIQESPRPIEGTLTLDDIKDLGF